MSRLNKTMCILAMSSSMVYTGEKLLEDDKCTTLCGEIKKKKMYLVSFKKLSPCFINSELKQFAWEKDFSLEPDVIQKNPYGGDVFLYEL